MRYSTLLQGIQREDSQQCYVNLPKALVQTTGWGKGQALQWVWPPGSPLVLQGPTVPAAASAPGAARLSECLEALIDSGRGAFPQTETFHRSARHLLSQLVCLGRHTITALLCTQNRQDQDWSSDYRHYALGRAHPEAFLAVAQQHLTPGQPLVTALDDSLLRKSGRHTYGVGYRRDPLSPPFHLNLVRGVRVLQLSAAWPYGEGEARLVPIDFAHAPLPLKPSPRAEAPLWEAYEKERAQANINRVASRRVSQFYQSRHAAEAAAHPLVLLVDGRFTHRTFFQGLPPELTVIGRVRQDMALFYPPEQRSPKGRKRRYGERVPTPEALLRDTAVGWTEIPVHFAGQRFTCRCKQLAPLSCRLNGGQSAVQLVVIASLDYRTATGKRICRRPTYLLCTEAHLPLEPLLQYYFWRWDIEVNFRDEKTSLGVGQSQVRSPQSTEQAPALAVAAYALLLVAALEAYGPEGQPQDLPLPRWRHTPPRRASISRLINQLRLELWAEAIERRHFSGFTYSPGPEQKPEKWKPELFSSLFYASD